MQDFRSYSEGEQDGGGKGKKGEGIPAAAAAAAKAVAALAEGRGEGEILRAIYKEAERSRRAGTLSDAELDHFCAAVAPMLDAAKRKKLEQVIAKLKKI